MKRELLYLSTIDEKAHVLSKKYGLGLELAEFCTAWNLDEKREETDRSIGEKMPYTNRFVLHGPFSELFPCAIDPMIRKVAAHRYRQTIEAAQALGVRKIVIHGGYNPKIYFPCWYIEQSVVFWKEFVKEIPDDITICLENVLEEEPEMLVNILREVDNPKIRMCLDVGHANAYSKISVFKWIQHCAPYISHFHVHNNDGTVDAHNPLNLGTIPMKELLSTIEQSCPKTTVTLELMEAESSLRWLLEENLLEESLWN